jgi:hypothetical protein
MPNLLTLQHPHPAHLITAAENRQWTILGEEAPTYLSASRRTRALQLSRQLMASSGLYQRLMWAIVDEVVPPSIQLTYSGDNLPRLHPQLDWIWKTGPSPLSTNSRNLVATFFAEGEMLLKPRINSQDGRITLTNISPDAVQSITKAEGISAISKVSLALEWGKSSEDYTIIRPGVEVVPDKMVFMFRAFPAGLTIGLRGAPLLMPLLDDMASATELMYGRITKLSRIATYYWDVLLTGASQEMVNDFLNSDRSTPPESGEVFAHNETLTWKYVKGEVENMTPELLFVINYLAGVAGLAPEFVGHTASRDITTEALFSAITHLQALQADVLACLEMIVNFAAQEAAKASNITLTKDDTIHIIAREVGSRLVQRQAQAFANFLAGLGNALEQNLLTQEQATAAVSVLLTRSGLVAPVQPSTRLAVIQ